MHPGVLIAIVAVVIVVLLVAQYYAPKKLDEEPPATPSTREVAPDIVQTEFLKRKLENEILDIENKLADLTSRKRALETELLSIDEAANTLSAKRADLSQRRRIVTVERITADKTLSDKFERIDNLLNQIVQAKLDAQFHLGEARTSLIAQTKLAETNPNSQSINIVETKAKIQSLSALIKERESQYAIVEADRIELMREIVRMQKDSSEEALAISRELSKIFAMETHAHADRAAVLDKLSKIEAVESDIAREKIKIEMQIADLITRELSITRQMDSGGDKSRPPVEEAIEDTPSDIDEDDSAVAEHKSASVREESIDVKAKN